jgi:hypothetical protein
MNLYRSVVILNQWKMHNKKHNNKGCSCYKVFYTNSYYQANQQPKQHQWEQLKIEKRGIDYGVNKLQNLSHTFITFSHILFFKTISHMVCIVQNMRERHNLNVKKI